MPDHYYNVANYEQLANLYPQWYSDNIPGASRVFLSESTKLGLTIKSSNGSTTSTYQPEPTSLDLSIEKQLHQIRLATMGKPIGPIAEPENEQIPAAKTQLAQPISSDARSKRFSREKMVGKRFVFEEQPRSHLEYPAVSTSVCEFSPFPGQENDSALTGNKELPGGDELRASSPGFWKPPQGSLGYIEGYDEKGPSALMVQVDFEPSHHLRETSLQGAKNINYRKDLVETKETRQIFQGRIEKYPRHVKNRMEDSEVISRWRDSEYKRETGGEMKSGRGSIGHSEFSKRRKGSPEVRGRQRQRDRQRRHRKSESPTDRNSGSPWPSPQINTSRSREPSSYSPDWFSPSRRSRQSSYSPRLHGQRSSYSPPPATPPPSSPPPGYNSRERGSRYYPSPTTDAFASRKRMRESKECDTHQHFSEDYERSGKDREMDVALYEPEGPPVKVFRKTNPPQYIPTSIKTQPSSHAVADNGVKSSDNFAKAASREETQQSVSPPHEEESAYREETNAEEEDEENEEKMREKLLLSVINIRKTQLEILSNSSSPNTMSPQRLELSGAATMQDHTVDNQEALSATVFSNFNNNSKEINDDDNDADEDELVPPPVLSRMVRPANQVCSLATLSKLKMLSMKQEPRLMPAQMKAYQNFISRPEGPAHSTDPKSSFAADNAVSICSSLALPLVSDRYSRDISESFTSREGVTGRSVSDSTEKFMAMLGHSSDSESKTDSATYGEESLLVRVTTSSVFSGALPTQQHHSSTAASTVQPVVGTQIETSHPTSIPSRIIEPTLKLTGPSSASTSISPAPNSHIPSATHSLHQKPVIQSSFARTSSPLRGASSLSTTSYSGAVPYSGIPAIGHVDSKRNFQMMSLPVIAPVVVHLHPSSSSEDEDDAVAASDKTTTATNSSGSLRKDMQVSQESLQHQELRHHEQVLYSYRASIERDQALVKKLIAKALRFVHDQELEERKREKLEARIRELTEQKKVAEKLARSFAAQRESTEKHVRLVTNRCLETKSKLTNKEKQALVLGRQLLGPSYVPRLEDKKKSQASGSAAAQLIMSEAQSKAQAIAAEKQKLIQKEKEIAEKLRLMRQVHKAATSKSLKKKTVVAKSQSSTTPTLQIQSSSINAGSSKIVQRRQRKEQDVIPIKNASAEPSSSLAASRRRRSVLDTNSSTVPNIALTPRRSISRESIEEARSERKDAPQTSCGTDSVKTQLSTGDTIPSGEEKNNFIMPTGSQLENLCKLQAEKMERQLKYRHRTFENSQIGLDLTGTQSQGVLNVKKSSRLKPGDLNEDTRNTGSAYTSPLLVFRAYRFSSNFRMKEKLSLQSKTYSHKLNPNCVLCPYDLQGTCNDDTCSNQHPRDYELSEQELLEDIVSYSPEIASVRADATPQELQSRIGAYVEKLVNRHKDRMSLDKLGLWLVSHVKEKCGKRNNEMIRTDMRRWKPESKVTDEKLSSQLKEFLSPPHIATIRTEKSLQPLDKDIILNEEDVRYFIGDTTESASLEAEITQDMSNTQLWLRLARKKLSNPNRTPAECLDLALSVLSRGLEVNQMAPDLWHGYLSLYRCHPQVQDFSQFCQTALEYAPSYNIWFLYLDSLRTFLEKDEVSMDILEFLWTTSKRISSTVQENTKAPANLLNASASSQASVAKGGSNSSSFIALDGVNVAVSTGLAGTDRQQHGLSRSSCEDKLLSHQVLEMIVYKLSLNVNAGRLKTAVNFVETILGVKAKASVSRLDCLKSLSSLLTVADHLAVWLIYIHVLEWHQLPSSIYGDHRQNPGCIMAKDNIRLCWKSKQSLSSSLDRLVKLHKIAAQVWTARMPESGHDMEADGHYTSLAQSLVNLVLSHGRPKEAVAVCRNLMTDPTMVDLWLTLARAESHLHAAKNVKQVFEDALSLSANSSSAKLHFYYNMYLFTNAEEEQALSNLEQFAISHFDVSSGDLRECDPNALYCRLLKQPEGFSLKMAHLKQTRGHHQHKDIHTWLCFCLLLELEGEMGEAVEMYERALVYANDPADLVKLWQHYLKYLVRSGTPVRELRDMVSRSLSSVPTKFHLSQHTTSVTCSLYSGPGTLPSAGPGSQLGPHEAGWWVDYRYSSQLVEAWLDVLPSKDRLDILEMCLTLQPSNVQLLLRTLDLCLEAKETRRAFSWCRLACAQSTRPANIAFWKMAVALAQTEGTQREIEQMFVGYVETMPLTIAGWKDFLLFEVSKKNQAAVSKLLSHCRQLGLGVDGFLATISPSASSSSSSVTSTSTNTSTNSCSAK
ncbi:zinc finger C3H1 domain-containing protein [Elysia marginata]|uniref:Zinc finger C3H1 domain-containing protein n=1 Tax=Elysia marginata TaxID=1093978 RepID=A0AAV4J9U8_9GAST|nr:zinc finger C3H1 domain-containing protein [Elysia marginata]